MSTLLRMESVMRFSMQNTNQNIPQATNARTNPGGNVAGGTTLAIMPNAPVSSMAKTETGNGDQNAQDANGNTKRLMTNRFDRNECRSCKTRRYMDGSNDPGVSLKTPTNIPAEQSASAVSAHEGEHVSRNAAKAEQEGREVVSSSVVLHTAICHECGVSYTAGGETTTVTRAKQDKNQEQHKLDTTA